MIKAPPSTPPTDLLADATFRFCDAVAAFRKAFTVVSRSRKATAEDVRVCQAKAKLDGFAVRLRMLPVPERADVARAAAAYVHEARRSVLGEPADWGYGDPDGRAESLLELYAAAHAVDNAMAANGRD